ncbi:MAG: polysaccharide biosynthesis tyrosine autokinase [Pseudomonadota bacterium]
MKYQKAIEKARQEQALAGQAAIDGIAGPGEEEAVAPDSAAASVSLDAPPVASAAGAAQGGWRAPVYSASRRQDLNAAAAMEHRVCLGPDAAETEHYKVLRTHLMQRMKPMGWKMVMVTSVRPGEGKSLTSVNLALEFAKSYNHTVLLVDCDLRQQSVYRYLGLPGERGVVDFLADGRELKDLIVWPGIDKLTVVSGGRTTGESVELLGSPRMRELMTELKERYDDRFIIIDAPPLLGGADAMTLTPYVDAVVVVVASGGTPVKEIRSALELVPQEKFMGFVLNKHASAGDGYYYRYYGRNGNGGK